MDKMASAALGYLLCVTVPLGLAVVAFPWLSEGSWPPCAIVIIALAYVTTRLAAGIYDVCITTLFVCVMRDCEHYDGRYMSKNLRSACGFGELARQSLAARLLLTLVVALMTMTMPMHVCHLVTAARMTTVFLPLLLAAAGGVVKSEDANVDTNTSLIIVSNPEIKTPAPLSHNPVAKSILRRRLCASPVANKLFSRAIMMSPASFTITPEQAEELAGEFARNAGAKSAGLADMQDLSMEAAQEKRQ
eukprot:s2462_g2.t1